MPPTVIIIRHAEALHNIEKAYHLHDPELSYLGIIQCGKLRQHLLEHLPIADQIELVVVSPMRRTLQTAEYSLSWLKKRGVPFVAQAEWQECSAQPCDTGSDIATLAKDFPWVDFGLVDSEWPSKKGRYEFALEPIQQRGLDARRWLKTRREKVVAVVSHSAILRAGVAGNPWANADYRVFEFEETEDDDDQDSCRLIQWKSTESIGGMGRSFPPTTSVDTGNVPKTRPS